VLFRSQTQNQRISSNRNRMMRRLTLLSILAASIAIVASKCPYLEGIQRNHDHTSVSYIISAQSPAETSRDYAMALAKLDWNAVVEDIKSLLITEQEFWPPDFGNYGPFMIRQAWHCAGSYRSYDGLGGCDGGRQRFDPERSWDDNTNLDKSKTLLLPIKVKYGLGLSWGDLIILTGNVAIQSMGGNKAILGFCGGRIDDSDGLASELLGPTNIQQTTYPCAVQGQCELPFGSNTIGLIYVNPEGVVTEEGGKPSPDPAISAAAIRDVFARMTLNDTETVALIGGGHGFGKSHGACPKGAGPSPKEDPVNPWPGLCGNGRGNNTYTSGIEGQWTTSPTVWSNVYFTNLLYNNWTIEIGTGGKQQWTTSTLDPSIDFLMLTTDMALKADAAYLSLSQSYAYDLSLLEYDFKHAWYKMTSRDMGPATRCAGPFIPEPQAFQYPLPAGPAVLPDFATVAQDLKKLMTTFNPKLQPDYVDGYPSYAAQYVHLAYQCASNYRSTDYKGGCNGGRIRFSPGLDWPINKGLKDALDMLSEVKSKYQDLSWADLIVLAGNVGIELSGGNEMKFCGNRTDALDGNGWELLQINGNFSAYPFDLDPNTPHQYFAAAMLIRSSMLSMGLSISEMVALAARPRSSAQLQRLGYNSPGSNTWTGENATKVSNLYFNLLLRESWVPVQAPSNQYELQAGSNTTITMLPVDLVNKYEADFKAVVESFASDNALFLSSFASAWTKLMNSDRFDGPVYNKCA